MSVETFQPDALARSALVGRSPFRILSIDGGGIKGTYSAFLLAELERELGPLVNHFDLLCGTSTGGLICLALSAGKSAAQIADFYESCGPRIFPDHRKAARLWRTIRQAVFKSRYDNAPLRDAIFNLIGETTLGQAQAYLCIPATNVSNHSPVIFKTRHSPRHTWPDVSMLDVALATSAAPTFLPIHTFPDACDIFYADGGLVANNPSLVGLVEALRVFVKCGKNGESLPIELLSIGNFDSPKGVSPWRKRSGSALAWMLPSTSGPPLVSCLMDAQVALTNQTMKILCECLTSLRYVRLSPTLIDPPSVPNHELLSFSLADGRAATISKLKQYGILDGRTAASRTDVRDFFSSTKQKLKLYTGKEKCYG
jgi:predicted acylesterase/phospholipase RssA